MTYQTALSLIFYSLQTEGNELSHHFDHLPGVPFEGSLEYDESEYSFRFEPGTGLIDELDRRAGTTVLQVGTLGITVGTSSGRVYFVDGLHEVRTRWRRKSIAPAAAPGAVFARFDTPLEPAVARRLAPVGSWVTSFDGDTGWVLVENCTNDLPSKQIIVATDTVLGFEGDMLVAIWLRAAGLR